MKLKKPDGTGGSILTGSIGGHLRQIAMGGLFVVSAILAGIAVMRTLRGTRRRRYGVDNNWTY